VLERQSHEALLELYAVESSLARARRDVDRLRSHMALVTADLASAERHTRIVARSLAASRARVAVLLKALYVEAPADPIAIVLGATSLEEALEGIDGLSRAAAQNRRLAREAREYASSLVELRHALADQRAALAAAESAASAAVAALEQRAAERASTVSALRAEGSLTRRRIAVLETKARAAELQSTELAASLATPTSTSPAQPLATGLDQQPDPGAGRTLVVDAVAYHLPGSTASGLPVGPGVIAVDPSVIPLGTRVYVPGYGNAVAADTGSAIIGNIIDLWMPSTPHANAWGRRTVTITIYD
jgi:3D (Asp-Asp-Asp) domain-containing protein/peptidoglycan hydrolase CwlO-like protein